MDTKTSIHETHVGNITFSQDTFNVPSVGEVFSARIAQKRDIDGNVIDGTVDKIILEVVNYKRLQAIIADGGSKEELLKIHLEYVADEETLKLCNPKDLVGKLLDLRNAEVKLRWVFRGNSGSWGGLKLICSTLKIVAPQTKTLTPKTTS